ncbi:metal-dependent hydrolase, partial [Salmonella enterica]|uniref:metal-dependent hydrolase n=1 Tax=Salmonella enterica TaxID=28901 RepID=UPI003519D809
MYLACEAWCRWERYTVSWADRMQLAAIACLATLLHIALDFTNSYGVHPFWPFDNRWYYGDAVFIVEPLFWAAC